MHSRALRAGQKLHPPRHAYSRSDFPHLPGQRQHTDDPGAGTRAASRVVPWWWLPVAAPAAGYGRASGPERPPLRPAPDHGAHCPHLTEPNHPCALPGPPPGVSLTLDKERSADGPSGGQTKTTSRIEACPTTTVRSDLDPTLEDIRAAAVRLDGRVHRTPCWES